MNRRLSRLCVAIAAVACGTVAFTYYAEAGWWQSCSVAITSTWTDCTSNGCVQQNGTVLVNGQQIPFTSYNLVPTAMSRCYADNKYDCYLSANTACCGIYYYYAYPDCTAYVGQGILTMNSAEDSRLGCGG